MTKEEVFALGFFVGTPTAKVYVPMAQEEKIPVVGLFTGAQMLYEPLKHYVINVRASYYDGTREQLNKLWEVNVRKIGVLYQDDAFGKTVLDGVKIALQKHTSAPVAEIVKKAHAAGSRPQFLAVSFVGTEEFIKESGYDADGTIITQWFLPMTAPIIRLSLSTENI